MTDEEGQPRVEALDDEAPPEVPDLSESPRSAPPPKPARAESAPPKPPSVQIPAVRPASLPPPPPSQRARAASDPNITVGSMPPPPLEGLDFDELPSDAPASTRRPLSIPPAPPSAAPLSAAPLSTPPLSAPPPPSATRSAPPRPRSSPPAALLNAPALELPKVAIHELADVAPLDDADVEPALDTVVEQEPPSPAEVSEPASEAPSAAAEGAAAEGAEPVAKVDAPESAEAAAASEEPASEEPAAEASLGEPAEPVDDHAENDGVASSTAAAHQEELAASSQAAPASVEPADLVIPDDTIPQGPMEVAPAPTSALMAMRIIRIGEPEAPPSDPEAVDAEELNDDDLAPDSGRYAEEPEEPGSERGLPKPPPPPRSNKRPPPPRALAEKERAVKEAAQKRKVRPWWEEVFGDDYVRATFTPSQRQIAREVDFIQSSLGVQPGGMVLDLACGSGEHAVELASRGFAVVGYDLSISQLAQAQEVAQERDQKLNFLQGDMREMAFEETFDAVYCWGSSFGYFEEEKNIQVAQRMLKALRPGGTLLLEVANRDYVAAQSPSSVWFEGDGCLCMDDAHLDWLTSRLKVKRAVMLDDGRSKEWNYSIRLYSLHELGKLLHDVGFVVRSASGQVATPGVFFGPASPSLIVLAQRPA